MTSDKYNNTTGVVGDFFDSRSSRRLSAVLYHEQGRARVFDAAGAALTIWENVSNLNISSRVANTRRFVRFSGDSVFETGDNDAIDRLAATRSPRAGLVHRLESRLRWVVLGLTVTICFSWATIQYGIPALADFAAFSFSADNNRRIGQGMLEALDKVIFSPSKLPISEQERIRRRFLAFIGEIDGIPLVVEFRQAKKEIGANALALPSGIIIFTDQLVELAKNDEELLGVFGHEAGHVERRHAMRGLLRQSALVAVVVAVTGDVSTVASLVAAAPIFLVQAGYSRGFELEADDFALVRLSQGGVDSRHFANILARLEASHHSKNDQDKGNDKANSQLGGYLTTHPAMAERLSRIQRQ